MKRLIVGTLVAFGVGALSFVATALIANFAHSNSAQWGSVDGMTPMWPLGVGFGAMSLMALSIVLLVACASVGLIRDLLARRHARA
ncbi:hypothetical protein [Rhodoglobus aureus]|uniref:Uncharacterized protein n=1 Tax=Rhodoglobus aureus TaxID=191497 RepID=A0ABN1VNZ5_9MICO